MVKSDLDAYEEYFLSICGDKEVNSPYIDCTEQEKKDFENHLQSFLKPNFDEKKCILGIDIYKYSQYDTLYQKIIPFIFHYCITNALSLYKKNEPYLSEPYDETNFLTTNFIDTGDGGFLIFNNPIDALGFLIQFAFVLHMFNSYNNFPKLRSCMGKITYRAALTFDSTYVFNSNHYGSGIINCARILSLDKLDRILLDDNTIQWFNQQCDSIESVQRIRLEYLCKCNDFKKRVKDKITTILKKDFFKTLISQKIGDITSKNTELSIYNLYMQISIDYYQNDDESETMKSILSIGNLNIQGLEKKINLTTAST